MVIEDEPDLREIVKRSFEKEAFLVETAAFFEEALDKIVSFQYDCILLDIMLPGGSGLDLLRKIRQKQPPDNVIIISAKDSLEDKITGLNLGADDYLPKPFHIAELTARVKSVLRRRSPSGTEKLSVGNVQLDLIERSVQIDSVPAALNRKEFDVLAFLMLNHERLVYKTALAEHVWGDFVEHSDDFDFIYSQIKNLRRKLNALKASVEVQAVYGVGYRLQSL